MVKKTLRTLIFLACIVGTWELIAQLEIWPDYIFPGPRGVIANISAGFAKNSYASAIFLSMRRLFWGFSLASFIGLAGGMLFYQFPVLNATFGLLLNGLQSLPSICWMPLALLWFGLNDKAILFVVVMGSSISMLQSTLTGIHLVPRIYRQAGRTLGANKFQLYTKIILPAALPNILEGFRQSWAFAWRSLMGGEMLFVTPGLGHLLNLGRELNDIDQVAAIMILILMIGLIFDRMIFAKLLARVLAKRGLGVEDSH